MQRSIHEFISLVMLPNDDAIELDEMTKKAPKIKTLINLEACDCRWPIGDPRQEGFHFCGAQQALGRPYCTEHWAMSLDTIKVKPGSARPAPLPMLTRKAA